MFGRDFENETKTSILNEITECQNASKIKMFFGVDEEGGTVVRVSAYKAFRNSRRFQRKDRFITKYWIKYEFDACC